MIFRLSNGKMILAGALAVWFMLILAEILHGIVRRIFLVSYIGDFRSSQVGVLTGSLIILGIALVFVRWIGATRPLQLLGIGLLVQRLVSCRP